MKPGLRSSAFSLIEVTIALGVVGFCMIAIFGLLPIAARSNNDSSSQTDANQILSSVIADLRATPRTSSSSPQYGIAFGSSAALYFDGGGNFSASLQGTSRYRLNIDFPPGSTGLVYAHVNISWPAAASASNASGSVETVSAFNRN